jgi:CheY-like chemotaxis protein
MTRVSSFAPPGRTGRPPDLAVRKLPVAARSCGNCGSTEIRPSNRRNALDIILACVFLTPFRCRVCRKRFYRVWRPGFEQTPDPPTAPLLLLPPRRRFLGSDAATARRNILEPVPFQFQPIPSLQRAGVSDAATVPSAASTSILPANVPAAEPLIAENTPQEFPAIAPQPLGGIPDPSTTSDAPGEILILESDLSIRKLLLRLLERRGYMTAEVAPSEDLAAELRERRAGLLVIDVSNTAASSWKDLLALAAALPSLKILALSEESPATPPQDHEIPGRLLTLPKPFALDSFVDSVDRLLERTRAPDAGL